MVVCCNTEHIRTLVKEFEKAFDTPPQEHCSVMELVRRQLNELMFSFATDNKELLLMALNLTEFLLYLVPLRAPFLVLVVLVAYK